MSSEKPKVYLAGPDIFRPDYRKYIEEYITHCYIFGLEAWIPFEVDFDDILEEAPWNKASRIFQGNRKIIEKCDAVIANLTPFRGVSADVGTVFEIGYAHAISKPVFGYTHERRDYIYRVENTSLKDFSLVDEDGNEVENFCLSDNLMVTSPLNCLYRGEESFRKAIKEAAKYFNTTTVSTKD